MTQRETYAVVRFDPEVGLTYRAVTTPEGVNRMHRELSAQGYERVVVDDTLVMYRRTPTDPIYDVIARKGE